MRCFTHVILVSYGRFTEDTLQPKFYTRLVNSTKEWPLTNETRRATDANSNVPIIQYVE